MGSASSFINSLPRDYSTASDAQLQQIINTSIIGQPWYDDDQLQYKYQQHQRWHHDALKEGYQIMPQTNLRCTVWERKCETLEDFALHSTIYEMKLRGFRAISVSEYRRFLSKYPSPANKNKIKLWVCDSYDSPIALETKTRNFCNVYYSESEGHLLRYEIGEQSSPRLSFCASVSLPQSKEELTEDYTKVLSSSGLDVVHYESSHDATHLGVDSQCQTEEWPTLN